MNVHPPFHLSFRSIHSHTHLTLTYIGYLLCTYGIALPHHPSASYPVRPIVPCRYTRGQSVTETYLAGQESQSSTRPLASCSFHSSTSNLGTLDSLFIINIHHPQNNRSCQIVIWYASRLARTRRTRSLGLFLRRTTISPTATLVETLSTICSWWAATEHSTSASPRLSFSLSPYLPSQSFSLHRQQPTPEWRPSFRALLQRYCSVYLWSLQLTPLILMVCFCLFVICRFASLLSLELSRADSLSHNIAWLAH